MVATQRWLARNAAGVARIRSCGRATRVAYTNLLCCLPALEQAQLSIAGPLSWGDGATLLHALAGCPRLTALTMRVSRIMEDEADDMGPGVEPALDMPGFAKLRGLTKLALAFLDYDLPGAIDCSVDALVPLTGLAELSLRFFCHRVVVPAAVGQLKALRSLEFHHVTPCVLVAGCLDLPSLTSLSFCCCTFKCSADADVLLPGVSALQNLVRIKFWDGQAPRLFGRQLAQLPRLQVMVFAQSYLCDGSACPRLPAAMGPLSSSLLHLDMSGLQLPQFPLALAQLVALKCLIAGSNDFAELPAAVTALSRLTKLALGRSVGVGDPLQTHETRPLDVRALGDLSAFPVLCGLSFSYCEVRMCESMLGAVRHASLACLAFTSAYPAPECALTVLQLSQALRDLMRGSVLRFIECGTLLDGQQDARGPAPFQEFWAALQAREL